MQIAMADARGFDLDEHLAGTRRVELGRLDGKRLSLFPQNGGVYLHECVGARLYFGAIDLSTRGGGQARPARRR